MPTITTKTTYLQMFAPPATLVEPPRNDVVIQRQVRPTLEDYRNLYRSVGTPWNWVDRLLMPDEALQSIVQAEHVEIFVLAVAGQTAGFAELDRRRPPEIELAYFGLLPEFTGQRLGTYLLNWALHAAWLHQPQRLWVHTCDLDSPAAIPTYLKAGFQIYEEQWLDQFIPESSGHPHRGT